MAAADERAKMSPQEEQLLQYLEDLQQNNPAEYEMLVKDLQEKEAARTGGKAPASQGEQVTPTPGFVAKTRSATNKGQKVFINVCSSDHVDKPAPVETANDSQSDELQMRIPLSLGPPREDLDKNGDVCSVYDVVFHPEAVDGALKEAEFRSFVMQLTVHQIQQKYKDEVSMDFSYPKVKGNYKGIAPMPQMMRKKGTPPPPPPGSDEAKAAEAAKAETEMQKNKPLIEEEAPLAQEKLPAPSYAVEPRRVASGSGEPDALSIKAHLPNVDDAAEIELQMSCEQVELLVQSVCALSLQLPRQVVLPPLDVKFETERKILSLLLKTDEAPIDTEEGGNAPAAGAGEIALREREREARLNARRRRAAGNQKLEKQAKAEAAAAEAAEIVEDAQTGASPATESGQPDGENADGAEGADGGAEAGTESASDSTKEKAKIKERQAGPIELSNSIMFELED